MLGWLSGGLVLGKEAPGFPLLYDLLTSRACIAVLPGDQPHNWGRLLLHLFPPEVRAATEPKHTHVVLVVS